jgi:hypothetical protein
MPFLMVSPHPPAASLPAAGGTDPGVRFRSEAHRRCRRRILIGQASALTTIRAETNAARFQAIAGLIREWQPADWWSACR